MVGHLTRAGVSADETGRAGGYDQMSWRFRPFVLADAAA